MQKQLCVRLFVFLVTVTSVQFALSRAQDLSKQDLAPFHWRLIGPFRGGRALAVAGVGQFPNRYYFGSVDGGVWESNNAGRTWIPIFDRQNVGSIGAIAVALSDPSIVYVGTGEADMRSDIALGNGMYRSNDAGKTWQHIGLEDSKSIAKIVVDSTNADHVFAAVLGDPYGPNPQRGVFESTNGGQSWTKILSKGSNVGAIDLAIDPYDSKVMYAALWETRRPPWNVYPPSNGPDSGLYKSIDGGITWKLINTNGFPDNPGRIGIAVSATVPYLVYALVDAKNGGLYRSNDAGDHWKLVNSDSRIWQRGWYFGGITMEPNDSDQIYICNTATYESLDSGKSFVPVKGAPGGDDYHTLWINSSNPDLRILGSDQGVVVSVDHGTTWSSWFNQPTAQIYHIATDAHFPYWVFGAQQDSGAVALPSRNGSTDGINMRDFHEITVGGESDMIAPDPLDSNLVYGGGVDRLNLTTGDTVSLNPTANYPGVYRTAWTLPLTFSKANPKELYYANQRVFMTRDGGNTWQAISPDLTRPNPEIPKNLDPLTAKDSPEIGNQRGVVYSLAPDAISPSTLWAGTDDGFVWYTENNGKNWLNVTPPQLSAWQKVTSISVSNTTPNYVYIAVDAHRIDDLKPYIYRTHDAGKTWKLITNGIPEGDFVNAVACDPKAKGLLYAATEHTVYFSVDDGDSWQSLKQNLPTTSVRDIVVKDADLVIATHGRGIYIMDDISPLRDIQPVINAGKSFLFQPETACRLQSEGFTGSPMPKSEPRGENPQAGAILDYWLPTSAKTVTLKISQAGKVIANFASSDSVQKVNLGRIDIAPIWISPPQVLGSEAGLHRFAWDLSDSHGNLAPPGLYTAALTVDGLVCQVHALILPDPRVAMTDSQYSLQQRDEAIAGSLNLKLSRLLASARSILNSIQKINSKGPSPVGSLAPFKARIEKLAGFPDPSDPRNSVSPPPKDPNSLFGLEDRLSQIQGEISNSDTPATENDKRALVQIDSRLKALADVWKTYLEANLPALNSQLRAAGVATIPMPVFQS